MSGAMPLLLLYAFMALAGKPLPFAVMFEGTLRFVQLASRGQLNLCVCVCVCVCVFARCAFGVV